MDLSEINKIIILRLKRTYIISFKKFIKDSLKKSDISGLPVKIRTSFVLLSKSFKNLDTIYILMVDR